MTDKKRLFIGIQVVLTSGTATFYNSISEILDTASVKWVGINNLHLTLKFLGDVGVDKISSINKKMELVAQQHDEFEAVLKGVGIFKNFYHPKVLWIGLRNCPEFEKLKNDIENYISDIGFEVDFRKFAPHLTLGRFRYPGSIDQLKKFISDNQDTYFQNIRITEIILYESILKRSGPEYKVVEKYPLGTDQNFTEFKF
ncbi:MAG: RNA 2',3'-cyclic phosphodiesterase [Candidatus Delongbacteria bacterium]